MSKFGEYVKSSYDELAHKVSWPTRKELMSSGVVVAVASLIIALIVLVMDLVFGITEGSIWKGVLGFIYWLIGQI